MHHDSFPTTPWQRGEFEASLEGPCLKAGSHPIPKFSQGLCLATTAPHRSLMHASAAQPVCGISPLGYQCYLQVSMGT